MFRQWEAHNCWDRKPPWRNRIKSWENALPQRRSCRWALHSHFPNMFYRFISLAPSTHPWRCLPKWKATWRWPFLRENHWPFPCCATFLSELFPFLFRGPSLSIFHVISPSVVASCAWWVSLEWGNQLPTNPHSLVPSANAANSSQHYRRIDQILIVSNGSPKSQMALFPSPSQQE